MTEPKVHEATLKDIPDLIELHQASWNEVYGPKWVYPTREDAEQKFSSALGTGMLKVLVVRVGNDLAGFLAVSKDSGRAEITDLYINQSYRRRGFGRILISRAIENESVNGSIALWVAATNFSAIDLYRSMQFFATGLRKSEPRRQDLSELIEMKRI